MVESLILESQSAFIPNRRMFDGVLVINELLDFAKRKTKTCMLFKVNFEKAYDYVSSNHVRYILKNMGFRHKWLKWT